MDEQQWLEEQLSGWLGRAMKDFGPGRVQLIEDFRAGRRGLDPEVSEFFAGLRFFASRVPKVSDDGCLICPHCQLQQDVSAQDLVKELPAAIRAEAAKNLVYKCPGCRQSMDISRLL